VSYPRTTCPHCGRDVPRRKNGAPFLHTSAAGAPRCDGSGFFDAQAPIPFRFGLRKGRKLPPDPAVCPKCHCSPFTARCSVALPEGGQGECLPAGTFGAKFCSACLLLAAAVLLMACGGAAFTAGAAADAGADDAPAAVDAGALAVDVAPSEAGDVLELREAATGDGGAQAVDAGPPDVLELREAAADALGDVLEHDAPDAPPPSCQPAACASCALGELPCCKPTGECGCYYASGCR
jgi:hypothetical protein